MEKSWGLLFYLKKPKNYKTGPVPIYLRITVNGEEKELPISLDFPCSTKVKSIYVTIVILMTGIHEKLFVASEYDGSL